jgi:hypothetical protein
VKPARSKGPPAGRRRIAAAVALVVLASAAAVTWKSTRRTRVPPAAPVEREAPPPEAAPPPTPPPADTADGRSRLAPARASLTCGGATGEAVFVAPERALGSLSCPEGQGQLGLADGRELLGRALPGAPPGTSVLALPGAAAAFAPTGAATALADGAPLLVGLDGAGPSTVGEATARGLTALDGTAYLTVADAAGALAGVVADASGAIVAVAPSVPPDPARPSLAVPVEAFAAALGREVVPAWGEAQARAADEDRRALGELWNGLRRSPLLLSATVVPGGVGVVVARASSGRPPAETIRLEVDPPARDCTVVARIVDWRTGPHATDGVPASAAMRGRLSRIAPPAGGGAIWVGIGKARVDCDPSRVADGATLSVPGSDPTAPVPFPRDDLVAAGAGRQEDEAVVVAADAQADADRAVAEAEEAAAWEAGWRGAFRDANARVAQAKQRRLDLEAQRDQARGNFQYVLEEQIATDLEIARMEEKRAEEALDELDKRASRAAVPRAWRRE